jgi:hypothetical protein
MEEEPVYFNPNIFKQFINIKNKLKISLLKKISEDYNIKYETLILKMKVKTSPVIYK